MKVFDIHSDLIHDVVKRRERGESNILDKYYYEDLKKSGIGYILMVIWIEREYRNNSFLRFIKILTAIFADIEESKKFFIVKDYEDLHNKKEEIPIVLGLEGLRFIEEWPFSSSKEDGQVFEIFSFLKKFYIKHAILAWFEINKIASGTGAENTGDLGLSDFGKKIVKKMEEEKYIIDLSHLDEISFWDVVKETSCPIICSHSNVRNLCDHPRNLTDDQIRTIAKRNGIIGINSYWEYIDLKESGLDNFIDHIDYIKSLVGVKYISFGFDFTDYIDSKDENPIYTNGLDSAKTVPDLLKRMMERGYSKEEIYMISSGNFLEFLKKLWSRRI